jgi:hypothetical protein
MNEIRPVKVMWPFFVEVCVFKAGEEYTTILFFGFGSCTWKDMDMDLALAKTSVDHGIHSLSEFALEKTSVDHGIPERSDLAQVLIMESMNGVILHLKR